MDDSQFLGLLIGSITTLLGIASVLVAIIIKPIINLNKTITKLDNTIGSLEREKKVLNDRVTQHGKEIEDNREHLIRHDKDIEYLKKEVKK